MTIKEVGGKKCLLVGGGYKLSQGRRGSHNYKESSARPHGARQEGKGEGVNL